MTTLFPLADDAVDVISKLMQVATPDDIKRAIRADPIAKSFGQPLPEALKAELARRRRGTAIPLNEDVPAADIAAAAAAAAGGRESGADDENSNNNNNNDDDTDASRPYDVAGNGSASNSGSRGVLSRQSGPSAGRSVSPGLQALSQEEEDNARRYLLICELRQKVRRPIHQQQQQSNTSATAGGAAPRLGARRPSAATTPNANNNNNNNNNNSMSVGGGTVEGEESNEYEIVDGALRVIATADPAATFQSLFSPTGAAAAAASPNVVEVPLSCILISRREDPNAHGGGNGALSSPGRSVSGGNFFSGRPPTPSSPTTTSARPPAPRRALTAKDLFIQSIDIQQPVDSLQNVLKEIYEPILKSQRHLSLVHTKLQELLGGIQAYAHVLPEMNLQRFVHHDVLVFCLDNAELNVHQLLDRLGATARDPTFIRKVVQVRNGCLAALPIDDLLLGNSTEAGDMRAAAAAGVGAGGGRDGASSSAEAGGGVSAAGGGSDLSGGSLSRQRSGSVSVSGDGHDARMREAFSNSVEERRKFWGGVLLWIEDVQRQIRSREWQLVHAIAGSRVPTDFSREYSIYRKQVVDYIDFLASIPTRYLRRDLRDDNFMRVVDEVFTAALQPSAYPPKLLLKLLTGIVAEVCMAWVRLTERKAIVNVLRQHRRSSALGAALDDGDNGGDGAGRGGGGSGAGAGVGARGEDASVLAGLAVAYSQLTHVQKQYQASCETVAKNNSGVLRAELKKLGKHSLLDALVRRCADVRSFIERHFYLTRQLRTVFITKEKLVTSSTSAANGGGGGGGVFDALLNGSDGDDENEESGGGGGMALTATMVHRGNSNNNNNNKSAEANVSPGERYTAMLDAAFNECLVRLLTPEAEAAVHAIQEQLGGAAASSAPGTRRGSDAAAVGGGGAMADASLSSSSVAPSPTHRQRRASDAAAVTAAVLSQNTTVINTAPSSRTAIKGSGVLWRTSPAAQYQFDEALKYYDECVAHCDEQVAALATQILMSAQQQEHQRQQRAGGAVVAAAAGNARNRNAALFRAFANLRFLPLDRVRKVVQGYQSLVKQGVTSYVTQVQELFFNIAEGKQHAQYNASRHGLSLLVASVMWLSQLEQCLRRALVQRDYVLDHGWHQLMSLRNVQSLWRLDAVLADFFGIPLKLLLTSELEEGSTLHGTAYAVAFLRLVYPEDEREWGADPGFVAALALVTREDPSAIAAAKDRLVCSGISNETKSDRDQLRDIRMALATIVKQREEMVQSWADRILQGLQQIPLDETTMALQGPIYRVVALDEHNNITAVMHPDAGGGGLAGGAAGGGGGGDQSSCVSVSSPNPHPLGLATFQPLRMFDASSYNNNSSSNNNNNGSQATSVASSPAYTQLNAQQQQQQRSGNIISRTRRATFLPSGAVVDEGSLLNGGGGGGGTGGEGTLFSGMGGGGGAPSSSQNRPDDNNRRHHPSRGNQSEQTLLLDVAFPWEYETLANDVHYLDGANLLYGSNASNAPGGSARLQQAAAKIREFVRVNERRARIATLLLQLIRLYYTTVNGEDESLVLLATDNYREVNELLCAGFSLRWTATPNNNGGETAPTDGNSGSVSNDQSTSVNNNNASSGGGGGSGEGALNNYLAELTSKLEAFVKAVGTVREKTDLVSRRIRSFHERPFHPEAIALRVKEIRKVASSLSLHCVNAFLWIKRTQPLLDAALAQQVQFLAHGWTLDFLSMAGDPRFLDPEAETDIFHLQPLRVRMRVIYKEVRLESPPAAWRQHWIGELARFFGWIDDLPRLYSDDEARVQVDEAAQTPAERAVGVAAAGRARPADGYVHLLARLPSRVVAEPLRAIEECVAEAAQFEGEWRESEQLLHLDVAFMQQRFENDLRRWNEALRVVRGVTDSVMDYTQPNRSVGGVIIVAGEAQMELGRKLDQMSQYMYNKFKDLLDTEVAAMRQRLQDDFTRVDAYDVISNMTDAARFLGEAPALQEAIAADGDRLQVLTESEDNLRSSGFAFPDGWTYVSQAREDYDAYAALVERKLKALTLRRGAIVERLESMDAALRAKVRALRDNVAALNPDSIKVSPKEARKEVEALGHTGQELAGEAEQLIHTQTALQVPPFDRSELDETNAEIERLRHCYASVGDFYGRIRRMGEVPFFELVPRRQQEELQAMDDDIEELPAAVRAYPQCRDLWAEVRRLLSLRRLMQDLRGDAMSPLQRARRHWVSLKEQLGVRWVLENLKVKDIWDSDPTTHMSTYNEVLDVAEGERRIEVQLQQTAAFWEAFQFDLSIYKKKVALVRGWDELFDRLGDDLSSFSGMRASPYFGAPQLVSQANDMENNLDRLRQILETLVEVQKRWVYLDDIFTGNVEIRQQLPSETTQYERTSRELTHLLPKPRPNDVLPDVRASFFLDDEKMLPTLERILQQLIAVQRALTAYLDTQRMNFPRFFFVGDEDLLEILANSKDPIFIGKHLRKMFTALASFTLLHDAGEPDNCIVGFASHEGEEVHFDGAHRVDYRRLALYDWLNAAERGMVDTLRDRTVDAARELHESDEVTIEWMRRYPAQCVVLALQAWWVTRQEELFEVTESPSSMSLIKSNSISGPPQQPQQQQQQEQQRRAGGGGGGGFLRGLAGMVTGGVSSSSSPQQQQQQQQQELLAASSPATQAMDAILAALAEAVLEAGLSPAVRHRCEQIITVAVYQRDVSRKIVQQGIQSPLDFQWSSVLRVYVTPERTVECRMADAVMLHGFEYIGIYDRLVQTPLTDRCYLTLMQALHTRLGGSPVGPAGTGKTESVKALGMQLGRHVLVFNCDEAFDFQAMSRIFRGLCQVGAWGCFDEFNRLDERTLSALSQQIQVIQEALRARSRTVELNGSAIPLHDNMGIFVTMNPGYTGRSNMPGNLKQLFRTVTMSAPDRETIAEVMLFAQGFQHAEQLSLKVVPLFRLCEDQFSRQSHYDFGLRALKSVLIAAGARKRALQSSSSGSSSEDGESNSDGGGGSERQRGRRAPAPASVLTLSDDDDDNDAHHQRPQLNINMDNIDRHNKKSTAAAGAGASAGAAAVAKPTSTAAMLAKAHATDDGMEIRIILESVIATVAPKLVTHDVSLFYPLLHDFFPGREMPALPMVQFRRAVEDICDETGLQASPAWVEKICQLQHTKSTRHGIMIVGPSCTGKTTAWKVLLSAMVRVDSNLEAQAFVLDPKVLTKTELFGHLDITTREWKDGVFTSILRKIIEQDQNAQSKKNMLLESSRRGLGASMSGWDNNNNNNNNNNKGKTTSNSSPKGGRRMLSDTINSFSNNNNNNNTLPGFTEREYWIIFDGDVDPDWVENLNSVLDDNKLLTLPNGERLGIPASVRILFEVQNLQFATPATVSRCGMIWFSEGVVPLTGILSYAYDRLSKTPVVDGAGRLNRFRLDDDFIGAAGPGETYNNNNNNNNLNNLNLNGGGGDSLYGETRLTGVRGKTYGQYTIIAANDASMDLFATSRRTTLDVDTLLLSGSDVESENDNDTGSENSHGNDNDNENDSSGSGNKKKKKNKNKKSKDGVEEQEGDGSGSRTHKRTASHHAPGGSVPRKRGASPSSDRDADNEMLYGATIRGLGATVGGGGGNKHRRGAAHPDGQRIQETMVAMREGAFARRGLVARAIQLLLNPTSKYLAACVMEFSQLQVLQSILALLHSGVWSAFTAEQEAGVTLGEAQLEAAAEKVMEWAVFWGVGAAMPLETRVELARELGLRPTVAGAATSSASSSSSPSSSSSRLTMLDVEVDFATGEWRLVRDRVRPTEIRAEQVGANDTVIPTVDTYRHEGLLAAWLGAGRSAILCGPPGSGKTMSATAVLNSSLEYDSVFLNFSSGTTVDMIVKTLEQYCRVSNTAGGYVMRPISGKRLIVFCDEINLPCVDRYGTQVALQLLRQLIERRGYYRPRDNVWINVENVQIVGACNPPTDAGRVPLSPRVLRWAPVLFVGFPSSESLTTIYSTYSRAVLSASEELRTQHAGHLAAAMVATYQASQQRFTPIQQPHYLYSPRELSRWSRAIYEGILTWDSTEKRAMTAPALVRLALHEGLRVFADRLVFAEERVWTDRTIDACFKAEFPAVPEDTYRRPLLYSTLLTHAYVESPREQLRQLLRKRLVAFCDEEMSVPLVVFDSMIDHVVHIDRVLRQPLGHVLIAGSSGVGTTIIARLVAWMGSFSTFWLKVHRDYTLDDFADDLRGLLRRSGCQRERICFIFDESNILQPAFLEYMNALLASGEVPGLFEGEEWTQLMQDIKDAIHAFNSSRGQTGKAPNVNVNTSGVSNSNSGGGGAAGANTSASGVHHSSTPNNNNNNNNNVNGNSSHIASDNYVDLNDDQSLYRWFLHNVKAHLHVIFTINPASSEFSTRVVASPALFNRCTIDWFGDWDLDTLGQITTERVAKLDFASAQKDFNDSRDNVVAAVVGAISDIHRSTQEINEALRTRYANQGTFITPRHFTDCVTHFVTLYTEKQAETAEALQHLRNGVNKLQSTTDEVAAQQAQLRETEKMMAESSVKAQSMLERIVSETDITKKERDAAEQLRQQLQVEQAKIAKEASGMEKDLAEAEPALKEAEAALGTVKPEYLREMRAYTTPPPMVKRVLEAVLTIMGEPRSGDWDVLKQHIRRDDFLNSVKNFKPEDVTEESRQRVRALMKDKKFTIEAAYRASKAAGPLLQWVFAETQYSAIYERVAPIRAKIRAVERVRDEKLAELNKIEKEIADKENFLKRLKSDYQRTTEKIATLKNSVHVIGHKCERATTLTRELSGERKRWVEEAEALGQSLHTILGDCVLSAAFLSYIGFFDEYTRGHILLSRWYKCLDAGAIPAHVPFSPSKFLVAPLQRLQWEKHGLVKDDLCLQNATIMDRSVRHTLLIDPSGTATTYLQSLYAEQKITKTSFTRPGYLKQLEMAVRFGYPIIMEDAENIDLALAPLLNNEYKQSGGRRITRIGAQDVDMSKTFKLFLHTRDSNYQPDPGMAGQVCLVNFTITQSSLESQCLNRIILSERPDIDARHSRLLEVQSENQLRQRVLEGRLLSTIADAKGSLLEDDQLIQTLADLKKESMTIQAEMARKGAAMQAIRAIESRYRPAAALSSKIFFAIRRFSELSAFYQYEVRFMFRILDDALAALPKKHRQLQQQQTAAALQSQQSASESNTYNHTDAAAAAAAAGGSAFSNNLSVGEEPSMVLGPDAGEVEEDPAVLEEEAARLQRLMSYIFVLVHRRAARGMFRQDHLVLALRLAQIKSGLEGDAAASPNVSAISGGADASGQSFLTAVAASPSSPPSRSILARAAAANASANNSGAGGGGRSSGAGGGGRSFAAATVSPESSVIAEREWEWLLDSMNAGAATASTITPRGAAARRNSFQSLPLPSAGVPPLMLEHKEILTAGKHGHAGLVRLLEKPAYTEIVTSLFERRHQAAWERFFLAQHPIEQHDTLPAEAFPPRISLTRKLFLLTLLLFYTRRDSFPAAALLLLRVYFDGEATVMASQAELEVSMSMNMNSSFIGNNNNNNSVNAGAAGGSLVAVNSSVSNANNNNNNSGETTPRHLLDRPFGSFFSPPAHDLAEVRSELSCSTPLLLVLDGSYDPSPLVEQQARAARAALGVVAMGSAESTATAERHVTAAMQRGGWVLLQNVHYAREYMESLEKRIHFELLEKKLHSDFRLIMTVEQSAAAAAAGELDTVGDMDAAAGDGSGNGDNSSGGNGNGNSNGNAGAAGGSSSGGGVGGGGSSSAAGAGGSSGSSDSSGRKKKSNSILPTNLLEDSVTIIYEASRGVKHALLQTFGNLGTDDDDADGSNGGSGYPQHLQPGGGGRVPSSNGYMQRLYLAAAWVHFVVMERLRYIPLGWTQFYEYSDTEFLRVVQAVQAWTRAAPGSTFPPSNNNNNNNNSVATALPLVSWVSLRAIISITIYGGLVDNAFDQHVMDIFCETHLSDRVFANALAILEKTPLTPEVPKTLHSRSRHGGGNTHAEIMKWVLALPDSDTEPAWLMLPHRVSRYASSRHAMRSLERLSAVQTVMREELTALRKKQESTLSAAGPSSATAGATSLEALARARWVLKIKELCNTWLPGMEEWHERLLQHKFVNQTVAAKDEEIAEELFSGTTKLSSTMMVLEKSGNAFDDFGGGGGSGSFPFDTNGDDASHNNNGVINSSNIHLYSHHLSGGGAVDPLVLAAQREVLAAVRLMKTLTRDLRELRDVCEGDRKPSSAHRALVSHLTKDHVPPTWTSHLAHLAQSMDSMPVHAWMLDAQARVDHILQLTEATEAGELASTCVSLGLLFHPGAYLTASKQQYARTHRVPLERVVPTVSVLTEKTLEADLAATAKEIAKANSGGAANNNNNSSGSNGTAGPRTVVKRPPGAAGASATSTANTATGSDSNNNNNNGAAAAAAGGGGEHLYISNVNLYSALVNDKGLCQLSGAADVLLTPVALHLRWTAAAPNNNNNNNNNSNGSGGVAGRKPPPEPLSLTLARQDPRASHLTIPLYVSDRRTALLAMVELPVCIAGEGETADDWYQRGVALCAWSATE